MYALKHSDIITQTRLLNADNKIRSPAIPPVAKICIEYLITMLVYVFFFNVKIKRGHTRRELA